MKLNYYTIAIALALFSCKQDGANRIKYVETFKPPVPEKQAVKKADSILNLLSLDDKLDLIKGYELFFIKGIKEFGLPQLYMSDASQGVNIREKLKKFHVGNQLEKSTAFPCTVQLAATWNPKISEAYAQAIGEECRAGGIGVLLGPGMNIYRVSQNGRSFEYMGEDPFLVSRMVERYVLGMQNTGTITTLKHFIANNNEFRRKACNVIVGDRALREIYMPAFKAGIDAGAMAVMSSYNLVNGEWAGQSEILINEILRKELGFKWLVMSDWKSVNDAKKVVSSGLDLEMPGGESMHNIKELLAAGEITESQIDRMVRSVLKTIIAMGLVDRSGKDESYLDRFEKHKKVALNTAREGVVLLKNDHNILPILTKEEKNILLTGAFIDTIASGGGSGAVKGYDHITINKALSSKYNKLQRIYNPSDDQIKSADVVIVNVGTKDREESDRPFALPKAQEKLILRATALNKNVIVVVNSGGGVRMTDWNDKVSAIIYNWYGGQEGNQALADIIAGEVSPSGHLPITIEKEFADSPGFGYISKDDLNEKQDVKIEDAPNFLYDINYNEGVLVGYRWYDTKKIEPLYPFGHGLSYTDFSYTDMTISNTDIGSKDILKVTFQIENTGKIAGATVAQVYVKDVASSVLRPEKELKGFEKIHLNPGEVKTVTIQLDYSAFSFWDENTRSWTVEDGEFEILLGESSRNIIDLKKVAFKN